MGDDTTRSNPCAESPRDLIWLNFHTASARSRRHGLNNIFSRSGSGFSADQLLKRSAWVYSATTARSSESSNGLRTRSFTRAASSS